MRRYISILIGLFLVTGCVYVRKDIQYKIRATRGNYIVEELYGKSYLKSRKKDLHISIQISEDFDIMKISFSDMSSKVPEMRIEVLNDVIVTTNTDKFIIKKSQIIYEEKQGYNGKKFVDIKLKFDKKLKGKIQIKFGKVRIGEKIFDTPEIVMQKYKVSESDSLMKALLNEGEVIGPLYRSEGWVEE